MTIKDNVISDIIDKVFQYLYSQYSFIESDRDKFKKIVSINRNEIINSIDENDAYKLLLNNSKKKIYAYLAKTFNKGNFTKIITNYINMNSNDKKLVLNDFVFINEILIKLDYNPMFDEYSELMNIEKIKIFIENSVNNNLEKVKSHDYSFLNDNSFLVSIVESYCIVNGLIEEDNDLEEETYDYYSESDDNYTNDSIKTYLREIGKYEILSSIEERKYFDLYKQGDSYAREVLINHNLRLVVSIARRYLGHGLTFLDLIQEGNIGLMVAINKFDVDKGFKLSTYATWWIRQAITRALADKGRSIRIPVHMNEKVNSFKYTRDMLTKKLSREPTLQEVADELNISFDQAKELNSFLINEPISMHTTVGDDDSELGDFIPDSSPSPADDGLKTVMKNEIYTFLENSNLKPRELEVLKYRFGLYSSIAEEMTLEEVGEIFGVSRERIRQIEKKALIKLRNSKKVLGFAEYLDDPEKAIKNILAYRKNHFSSLSSEIDEYSVPKKEKNNQSSTIESQKKQLSTSLNNKIKNDVKWVKSEKTNTTSKSSSNYAIRVHPKAKIVAPKTGIELYKSPVINTEKEEKVIVEEKVTETLVERKESELDMKSKFELCGERKRRSFDSIYHYFEEYSEEQVDNMLSQLPEKDIKILHIRFGADFKNPIINQKITEKERTRLYGGILPKMKGILEGRKTKKSKLNVVSSSNDTGKSSYSSELLRNEETTTEANVTKEEELSGAVSSEMLPTNIVDNPITPNDALETIQEVNSQINNQDYLKILEIFNNPQFIEMTKAKPLMECLILSLKLGYIDDKYFSSSAIANFLDIDVKQVNDIAKNGLIEYKQRLNQMIDSAIEGSSIDTNKPYTKVNKNSNV